MRPPLPATRAPRCGARATGTAGRWPACVVGAPGRSGTRPGRRRRAPAGAGRRAAPVELRRVEADGLVEGGALVVVQVHGHVHRQAEEAAPQLGLPVVEELRARARRAGSGRAAAWASGRAERIAAPCPACTWGRRSCTARTRCRSRQALGQRLSRQGQPTRLRAGQPTRLRAARSHARHTPRGRAGAARGPAGRPRARLRLRLQDGGEEVAVPVLVLAPVLKVLEQRVQLAVRVALQVAVDADVPPVADLRARRARALSAAAHPPALQRRRAGQGSPAPIYVLEHGRAGGRRAAPRAPRLLR